MAWTAPRTWVVAEIVTAALMNTHVRDDLRYLKGLDGIPTIQNGLIVDNSLGTEYLQIPSLTTTQRDALTPINGMMIYNSTLTVFQRYEAAAWVSYTNLAAMTIASIAQGDIFFRGASIIERLGAGTSGLFLKTQGVGANPIWATAPWTFNEYTSNDTWTKPGSATFVMVECVGGGGGGGGGNGAAASNSRSGGGGGGGGAIVRVVFDAADLSAGEDIVVGTGGTGGAGGVSGNGSDGTAGGTSSFGDTPVKLSVYGGGGGEGGGAAAKGSGGGGGGTASVGSIGAAGTGGNGGNPTLQGSTQGNSLGGRGAKGEDFNGSGSYSAEYGGGGGGAENNLVAHAGGSSLFGAGAGGGGGSVNAADTEAAGAAGGAYQSYAAGGGGTGGLVNGGAGGAGTAHGYGSGDGGGGGGGQDSGTGGVGGIGGAPGGGGGGGSGGTSTGGTGGNGGAGVVRVWTW